jgi:hypothetical protein
MCKRSALLRDNVPSASDSIPRHELGPALREIHSKDNTFRANPLA